MHQLFAPAGDTLSLSRDPSLASRYSVLASLPVFGLMAGPADCTCGSFRKVLRVLARRVRTGTFLSGKRPGNKRPGYNDIVTARHLLLMCRKVKSRRHFFRLPTRNNNVKVNRT